MSKHTAIIERIKQLEAERSRLLGYINSFLSVWNMPGHERAVARDNLDNYINELEDKQSLVMDDTTPPSEGGKK